MHEISQWNVYDLICTWFIISKIWPSLSCCSFYKDEWVICFYLPLTVKCLPVIHTEITKWTFSDFLQEISLHMMMFIFISKKLTVLVVQ